jgi:hypothetical protein
VTPPADDLPGQIRAVLSETGDKFEMAYPGARDRMVHAIAPPFEALLGALDRFAQPEIQAKRKTAQPDGYAVAWQILWDACNALLASFTLLQRGYETESIGVARGVLERVACAIVLFDNPALIPRFTSGSLKDLGTKSIAPAGKVITDLAPTWGLFSQLGSHIGVDNLGTGFIAVVPGASSNQLHMAIGGKIEATDPERREAWEEFISELCRLAERLLTPAPEQIFFNERRMPAKYPGQP